MRLDITGKRFGKLVAIKWTKFKGVHRYWLCQCDCGKTSEVAATHLVRNKTSSCGCAHVLRGENNNGWKGYGGISGSYFSSIKHKALARKIKFKITIEYIWDLFLRQEGKCALSGVTLKMPEKWKGQYTASLDRIDSSKGYEKGNVQWVLGDINWMKNDFDQNYFIDICRKIAHHSK